MRKDGLLERYTGIFREATSEGFADGYREGHTSIIGLYRMFEQSFMTYQSTHYLIGSAGVVFPHAWDLAEGDEIWDYTEDRYYRVTRANRLFEESGSPDRTWPDIKSWKNQPKKGHWQDVMSSGWIGFATILEDTKTGDAVRPPTSNVLLFNSARSMLIHQWMPSLTDAKFEVRPEADKQFDEMAMHSLPFVAFYTVEQEPGTPRDGWFQGTLRQRKPSSFRVQNTHSANLRRMVEYMPLQARVRFELWVQSSHDAIKIGQYFQRFVERCAPVWKKNGLMEWGFWRLFPADRRVIHKGRGVFLEYVFLTASIDSTLETTLQDIIIEGPSVITQIDGSSGSTSPTGEPYRVAIAVTD